MRIFKNVVIHIIALSFSICACEATSCNTSDQILSEFENKKSKPLAFQDSQLLSDEIIQSPAFLLLPNPAVEVEEYYCKIQTYQMLASLGCPVLPSAVLYDKSALKEENLSLLQKHLGGTFCSLRYQYKLPCLKPIRGGNKAPLTKEDLEKHWREELILWPVAHADRIKNQYGINILYRPSLRKIHFEIVGQGFDGTDLNKGDISPHQAITINLPGERGVYEYIWHQALATVVDEEDYKKSIILRKEKLAKLGIPLEEVIIPQRFTPLTLEDLINLDYYANKVFKYFNYDEEINISSTILEDGRIVFWDFQTPQNKSEAFFGKTFH